MRMGPLGLFRFRTQGLFASVLFALVLVVCVPPRPAQGSTAQVTLSNITFNGVSACSLSPCEDLNISFSLNGGSGTLIPGNMNIQSSGAFGGFVFNGEVGSAIGTAFAWSDSQGVLLSLLTPCTPGQLGSGCSPTLNQIVLTCLSLSCAVDFGIGWTNLYVTPNSGSVSNSVSTPEPSLLVQLLLGLLFLSVYLCWIHRKTLLPAFRMGRL